MLAHLGYRPPLGGACDVSSCRMVPPHVRVLFENCGGNVPLHVGIVNEDSPMRDDVPLEPIIADSVVSETEPLLMSQSTQHSDVVIYGTPPRELRQLNITEGFNVSTKQLLDRAWATAFYEANIPFNIVRHPAFVHAVRETARHRMPAYTPPSYNAMRTKLLTDKKVDLDRQVKEKLGNSVDKYGVTICCDGWDNVQNRPLLNVLQCGTKGDVFLGTIDTTGNHKDHVYVAAQIQPFVEKVGRHNVVQVCTDNAPVMASACRDLIQANPDLYFQGCAAHCLDLLLEDWGKEEWVKKLVKKGRHICVFIKNHHAPQAIFRRLSPNHSLRLPVETRFATNFIMIERLLLVRNALERMVVDEDWLTLMRDLRRRSGTAWTKGFAVRRFIRSDGFWNTCENFLYMVIPVVKALRVFDGKAPAMGMAWKVMHDLQTHIRGFSKPPFRLSPELAANAMGTFENRWRLMLNDLHWAGAMLNPVLRSWAPLHEHENSRTILNRVLRRLTPDQDTYVQILHQYQDFLENRGPFADSTDPNMHAAPLHEWWDAMGGGAKALQTIARRILAQVCSASACERNWSMYSYVHNKSRNRLKHSRAEDLVYIYTNSRLIRHRRGPRPAQWYEVNEVHSDDDLDEEDDNEDDVDPNDGVGNDEDNNVDDLDDDLDDLDSERSESDDDDDEGYNSNDRNLGVFDFDEADAPHNNDGMHDDHEGSIGGPPFETLHNGQGCRLDHNVAMGATENLGIEVDSLQPHNDSPSFGGGDNVLPANEATHVQQDPFPGRVHSESMDASLISNHRIEVQTSNVAEMPITRCHALQEIASTSTVQVHAQRQHRPLTRSIANTSRLGVSLATNVGATLVAIHNVSRNVAIEAPRRQSVRRHVVQNIPSAIPPASVSLPQSQSNGRGDIGIGGGSTGGAAIIDGSTDEVHSSRGRGGGRQRTTRGVKRTRKRYQGRSLPFTAEDYNEDEGRPHLDENGIHDAQGSRPTKKIIISQRDRELRLRSATPQTDDDFSTDESEEDPRCVEANDPTVRIRT